MNSLLRPLALALLTLFLAIESQAIEAQNPVITCDRFLTATEREHCKVEIKKLNPDWYLAGVCNKQFEDKSFYDCLNLSKSAQFSPQKLTDCEQLDGTDEVRMACIQDAKVTAGQAFQDSTPTHKLRSSRSSRLNER